MLRADGASYEFTPAYIGRLGYYYSLKVCVSGLVLQSEVSVNCFLKGGKLIELMAMIAGTQSVEDLYRQTSAGNSYGLNQGLLSKLEEIFKGYKLKLLHVGHRKVFKSFGPTASHPDSEFVGDDEVRVTVEKYYERKAKDSALYAKFLPNGGLRYPNFPTVNVGGKKRQTLIPVELVEIVSGQSKTQGLPSEVTSNIIRYAAMVPKDRFRHLDAESKKNGLLAELTNDENVMAFGLNKLDLSPMKVSGFILPPPKLQYKNKLIEPELKGSWNLAGGVQFKYPPPEANRGAYGYAVVVIYRTGTRPPNADRNVDDFVREYEKESKIVNIPMESVSKPQYLEDDVRLLKPAFEDLQRRGARVVVCLLNFDGYANVKYASDSICLPTQCVKWSNLIKPPRNYATSLLVKINYKLGGVNHTLASRAPSHYEGDEESFQNPPKSISWLFDEPCMLLVSLFSHC